VADFLEEVTAKTRLRVDTQKARVPLDQLRQRIFPETAKRSFEKALHQRGKVTLIAELKQASPSAGTIRIEAHIADRIRAYAKGGAAALSILTEEEYFHGSPHLLEEARTLTSLPLLRKDFIIDPYQIVESKTLGADAILLITSLLPGSRLQEFIAEASAVGLEALVEIHDEKDLEAALAAKATLIGINNRNLRTLRVDRSKGEKLLAKAPKKGVTLVIESGITSPAELPHLKALGAHAVLIGETLMRSEEPEKLVKEFVLACRK
jgi:indole-3-glycerol phosphate synthase